MFENGHEMGSLEPHIRAQNWEKSDFFWVFCEGEEQAFSSQLVTADGTWVFCFELATKGQSMEWHHPQYPGKKTSKSDHQQARSLSLSSGNVKEWFTWMWCQEGRQSTLSPMLDVARTRAVFKTSSASQESGVNLTSGWQSKTTHKFEHSQSHHKVWTALPHPPYSRYLALSCLCLFGALKNAICNTEFETSGSVIHMSRTRHTYTYSSFAQGHRSWLRCSVKTGYGVKLSHFIGFWWFLFRKNKTLLVGHPFTFTFTACIYLLGMVLWRRDNCTFYFCN